MTDALAKQNAENQERAAFIHDRARKSGISEETARQLAKDLSDPRPQRSKLSGEWPDMPMPPAASATKYQGAPPTIDSGLWLKKIAWTLSHPIAQQLFARQDLPIIANCRVRFDDSVTSHDGTQRVAGGWWTDGCIRLDLEHRHVGGRREFTTAKIPVSACLEHDTRWVIREILKHLGGPTVRMVETMIFRETDLFHVHGG